MDRNDRRNAPLAAYVFPPLSTDLYPLTGVTEIQKGDSICHRLSFSSSPPYEGGVEAVSADGVVLSRQHLESPKRRLDLKS